MSRSSISVALLLSIGCAPRPLESNRDELVHNLSAQIARADRDGDGRLSRDEWQAVLKHDLPTMSDADLRRIAERDFGYYDRNRDGYIDAPELAGPSLAGFDCLDTDHNHRLSTAELAAAERATCLPTRRASE